MDRLWSRIETWLAANAPALAAGFNPPATERNFAETEPFLGVRLPEDVRLSYLRHNGHWSLFGGWEWYSLERVRYDWACWKGLLDAGRFTGMQSDVDGLRIRKDWWNPAWIPLFYFEGDNLLLDLAPGPQGTAGQILELWRDHTMRPVAAANFTELLTDFADDFEAGWMVVCKETGELDRLEWVRATLTRRGGRFRQKGWAVALNLARQFGWEPAGTRPPRGVRVADWDASDYTAWAEQQVTEADALALASALGRALAAIPKGNAAKPVEGASRELAYFTGFRRRELADLAKYCKRGAFRVTEAVYDE